MTSNPYSAFGSERLGIEERCPFTAEIIVAVITTYSATVPKETAESFHASSFDGGGLRIRAYGIVTRAQIDGLRVMQRRVHLKDMQRTHFTKETEWLFEKSQMASKITQLESQLQVLP